MEVQADVTQGERVMVFGDDAAARRVATGGVVGIVCVV
jgi:hypothetical protein